MPLGRIPHLDRGAQHPLLHRLHVGAVRHRQVDDHASPALRVVTHPKDLTVSHEPQRAIDATDLGDADADRLDHARGRAEIYDISYSELVLGHHEQSVEDVFDDVLCPETETRAERGGDESERTQDARIDRCNGEQQRHDHDDDAHDISEHRTEGAGALHHPRRSQGR